MSEQPNAMPPSTRAPLDPWPTQQPSVPESDEPFGPREAGPDEPLEDWKTPVGSPGAGAPATNEGRPSLR